jgi:hypothetical protein
MCSKRETKAVGFKVSTAPTKEDGAVSLKRLGRGLQEVPPRRTSKQSLVLDFRKD